MKFFDKVNKIKISSSQKFELFPFCHNSKFLEDFPIKWGMTFKKAGSMRFSWNEENLLRDRILLEISEKYFEKQKKFVPVELKHSKEVLKVFLEDDSKNIIKDGILTSSKDLVPVITCADCVPIFFCDVKNNVFGVVHSGWKGTGIIENALKILHDDFSSEFSDILIAIGPHIQKCCYTVQEERALFFRENFGENCVSLLTENEKNSLSTKDWKNEGKNLFSLSLLNANLFILEKNGIKPENVLICENCTCCEEMFGSNRRETLLLEKEKTDFDRTKSFTLQAAFTVNLSV